MAGESVFRNTESQKSKRKWHFPHGFMVGVIPVLTWSPVWLSPSPEEARPD
jgi:hypothetical protein